MDDDDDEVMTIPAVRLKPIDVAIVMVDGVASVFGAIESVFSDITRMLCKHANWMVERQRVAMEMQESIERIVKE